MCFDRNKTIAYDYHVIKKTYGNLIEDGVDGSTKTWRVGDSIIGNSRKYKAPLPMIEAMMNAIKVLNTQRYALLSYFVALVPHPFDAHGMAIAVR